MIAPIRRFQIVRHSLRAEAYQQHRIKIERAVRLVRTGSAVRAALRSVGLKRFADWEEVARICDQRGIPRRRGWGMPLAIWKTQTPNPAHVLPGHKKILE
jgi:hypothetical protein